MTANRKPSARIPTARQARTGMLVRQQALDLAQFANDHLITATEHIYEVDTAGRIVTDYYVITTNRGIWTFSPDELVTFPRRPDNVRRDWRRAAEAPTALQLAVGDILGPRIPPLPDTDEKDLEEMAQRVIAVTRNRSRPRLVTVTTRSGWEGPLQTEFLPDEPVQYPRPEAERPSGYDRYSAILIGYGPYHTADDKIVYLLTHPAGRGRWPAHLHHPIPLGGGAYFTRPPKTTAKAEDWPVFVGTDKWRRHPKDPAWMQEPFPHEIPPERLQAAEAAYTDYEVRTA